MFVFPVFQLGCLMVLFGSEYVCSCSDSSCLELDLI